MKVLNAIKMINYTIKYTSLHILAQKSTLNMACGNIRLTAICRR